MCCHFLQLQLHVIMSWFVSCSTPTDATKLCTHKLNCIRSRHVHWVAIFWSPPASDTPSTWSSSWHLFAFTHMKHRKSQRSHLCLKCPRGVCFISSIDHKKINLSISMSSLRTEPFLIRHVCTVLYGDTLQLTKMRQIKMSSLKIFLLMKLNWQQLTGWKVAWSFSQYICNWFDEGRGEKQACVL